MGRQTYYWMSLALASCHSRWPYDQQIPSPGPDLGPQSVAGCSPTWGSDVQSHDEGQKPNAGAVHPVIMHIQRFLRLIQARVRTARAPMTLGQDAATTAATALCWRGHQWWLRCWWDRGRWYAVCNPRNPCARASPRVLPGMRLCVSDKQCSQRKSSFAQQ
jgi:hypothetical protein